MSGRAERISREARDSGLAAQLIYLGAILTGGILLVFREDVLPTRFFYDSARIQAEAAGTRIGPTDESFAAIATVYRTLGLAERPEVAAWIGFMAVVVVVGLARDRTFGVRAGRTELFLTFVTVFLGAVYLANYSKDVVVLIVTVLCLRLKSGIGSEVIFVTAMIAYGFGFRDYWFLVAAAYVCLRLLWKRVPNQWWLYVLCAAGIATGAVAFTLILGVEPDHFREKVNEFRLGGADASTAITRFVEGGGLPVGIMNVLLAGIFLMVPVPLFLLGSAYHAILGGLIMAVWLSFFLTVRQTFLSNELKSSALQARAICLVLAVVVTQSLEPDYGSALRHLTPLLPLFLACSIRVDAVVRGNPGAIDRAATDKNGGQ